MEGIMSFIFPANSSGILHSFLTLLNPLLILACVFGLDYFLRAMKSGKKVSTKIFRWTTLVSICFIFILATLSIYSPPPEGDTLTSTDKLAQFLIRLLDPIFQINSMKTDPLFGLTGINLSLCVVLLCVILALIPFLYKKVSAWATAFGAYLKNNMPEQTTPTSTTPEANQNSESASNTNLNGSKLIKIIAKLLPPGSFLTVLFGYIFGTDEQQESINDVLEAFESFLNTFTFNAQLDEISSISAFLSNFFYIVLSICVLAIYGVILASAFMLVKCAFHKKDEIIAWMATKAHKILFGVGVTLLLVSACTVVFVFSSGFVTLQQAFNDIFSSGTQEVFDLVIEIVILILAICAVMFIVGFGIVFAIFTIKFCAHTVTSGFDKLQKFSDKIPYIAAALFVIIIGVGLLIGFVLGYDSIRDGLHAFFNGSTPDTISPLWVVGHMFMLIGIVFGLILAVFSILILGKVVFSSLVKFSTDKDTAWCNKFIQWIETTVEQLIHLLHLIPFTIKHIAVAARNFIATMLRIFVGYSTESQKNKALFVAACFASLASLLNTFFGLQDFYSNDKTIIPVICSFAIACAVQLAMLIFGMKAGEGFAERAITKNGLDKGNEKTVLSKIFLGLSALTIYAAVVIIFCIYLFNREEKKLTTPTILAILLFVLTTWCVIYYVISQCMSIRALRRSKQPSTGNSIYTIKRINPNWYMTAYLLLMIVSTGFAFNNLFGYYADKAHLHQRVYEQVRSEADKVLNLDSRVAALVERYYANNHAILREIDSRADEATAKLQSDLAVLEAKILALPELPENKETKVRYQNSQAKLQGHTRDFDTVVATLKTYLSMEVEDMSDNTTLTIYNYEHYWGNSSQPSYITKCIKNTDSVIFGREIPIGYGDKANSVTVTLLDGAKQTHFFINQRRFYDPDSRQQTIAFTYRTINYADKYVILHELLSIFEELESYIRSFEIEESNQNPDENSQNEESESGNDPPDENKQKEDDTLENNSPEDNRLIYDLLNENAQLDGIRANIAALYRASKNNPPNPPSAGQGSTADEDMPSTSEGESTAGDGTRTAAVPYPSKSPACDNSGSQSNTSGEQQDKDSSTSELNGRIAVQDLPRIVSKYVTLTFSVESDKEKQYTELNDYIDRALNIHDIMVVADNIVVDPSQSTSESENQQNYTLQLLVNKEHDKDSGEKLSNAYSVRTYLNYAQGIAFSNFQISYDALLRGNLGLNPDPKKAIDTLYSSNIVAIFMLLICALVDLVAFFSGLLLFKNIFLFRENERIKEIGYLNYDAILTDFFALPEKGTERILHLAFIYRILYGESNPPKNISMNNKQFEAFYRDNLETLNIENNNLPDVRLWLTSFVQENDVKFDELLFEQEDPLAQEDKSQTVDDAADEMQGVENSPETSKDNEANGTNAQAPDPEAENSQETAEPEYTPSGT